MKTLALVTAFLALAGFASAENEAAPVYDQAALKPILEHSWIEGPYCDNALATVDWVMDGTVLYRRDDTFTPMAKASFAKGEFTTQDEIGVGVTRSIYRLQADGTLRLWTELYYEDGDPENGTATPQVQNGLRAPAADEPGPAAPTPSLKPCPQRAHVIPDAAITALDGTWADVNGGDCAAFKNAIRFDLKGPIPRIAWDDNPDSQNFVFEMARRGDVWDVTSGGYFDAGVSHFTSAKDGSMSRTDDDRPDTAPIVYRRCPG